MGKPVKVTHEIPEAYLCGSADVMKIFCYDQSSPVRWAHLFILDVGSLNSAQLLTGCGTPGLNFRFLLCEEQWCLTHKVVV